MWRDELRQRCRDMDEGTVELRDVADVFATSSIRGRHVKSIRFYPAAGKQGRSQYPSHIIPFPFGSSNKNMVSPFLPVSMNAIAIEFF